MLPTTTPSEADLCKLSHWGRVAFAARCARRVQPIFVAWAEAWPEHITAIERAITNSEIAAQLGRDGSHDSIWGAAYVATTAADKASQVQPNIGSGGIPDNSRNAAAAAAASSAANAYASISKQPGAATAAAADAAKASPDAIAAIWSDYNKLLALTIAESLIDHNPVDTDRLGPLG